MTYARFLFGAARSGTNAITWALETASDIEVFNEDNTKAFIQFRLHDNFVLDNLRRRCEKEAIFFKAFSDTSRYWAIMNFFPEARAIYAVREPLETIASFRREFGSAGVDFWLNAWRDLVDYDAGLLLQSCRGDQSAALVARRTAAYVLKKLDTYGASIENVAGGYYLWQHSFFFDIHISDSEAIKIVDYADLVEKPAQMMTAIAEWFRISNPTIDIPSWHKGRGTINADEIAGEILQECSLLYWNIKQHDSRL